MEARPSLPAGRPQLCVYTCAHRQGCACELTWVCVCAYANVHTHGRQCARTSEAGPLQTKPANKGWLLLLCLRAPVQEGSAG